LAEASVGAWFGGMCGGVGMGGRIGGDMVVGMGGRRGVGIHVCMSSGMVGVCGQMHGGASD
jgi:hypothetical protein